MKCFAAEAELHLIRGTRLVFAPPPGESSEQCQYLLFFLPEHLWPALLGLLPDFSSREVVYIHSYTHWDNVNACRKYDERTDICQKSL